MLQKLVTYGSLVRKNGFHYSTKSLFPDYFHVEKLYFDTILALDRHTTVNLTHLDDANGPAMSNRSVLQYPAISISCG